MEEIKNRVKLAAEELLEYAKLSEGDIFVLGASTSEVQGMKIGKSSSEDIGHAIVGALLEVLKPRGIYLAVQGCEHINRSLVIEKEAQKAYGYEEVTVKPALHAGGACSMAAYELADDPVVIEHVVAKAGLDIGDTSIGMHVKYVQIPVRLAIKEIGMAHVTALKSRPKLIGGPRAEYPDSVYNKR